MTSTSLTIILLQLLAPGHALPLDGDTVTIYDSRTSERLQRRGEIVGYNADELQLKLGAGQTVTIPTQRVTAIATNYTPAHEQARQFLAIGEFDKAVERLNQALVDERRVWVREMIVAEQVRCELALQKYRSACERFLRLYYSNPQTAFFGAIPLCWMPNEPDLVFEKRCQEWLGESNAEIEALIGATWLLSSRHQFLADAKLKDLARSSNKKVVALAKTQRWRKQLASVRVSDLEAWESAIASMPQDLRAGPTYLFAEAQRRLGQPSPSAVSFLRLPILYPDNYGLVSQSLANASQILKEVGDTAGAMRIDAERQSKFRSLAESPKKNVIRFDN